jgi:hypothetical protein
MPVLKGRARRKRPRPPHLLARNTAKEPHVTWSLRLPISLHFEFKRLAKEQGRSANKQIEMLIRKAIADEPKPAMSEAAEPRLEDKL